MKDKLFSKATIILMLFGFVINIVMVYVASVTGLPLYLDAIGTILVAVLGGVLPGITVGFFSNVINYAFAVSPDPLTLYYGMVSVLLAVAVVYLAKYGLYKKIKTTVLAVFVLAFIGGGIGSIITWFLYGFQFGENVSSSFVLALYDALHCRPFVAQLTGDYLVDLVDKGVDLAAAFVLLKILPKKWMNKTPYGQRYTGDVQIEDVESNLEKQCRKQSLKTKLTVLIVGAAACFGIVTTVVGLWVQQDNHLRDYESIGKSVASAIAMLVDGDAIDSYISNPESTSDYNRICEELLALKESVPEMERITVFCIQNGQNRSVFQVDSNAETVNRETSIIVWPTEIQEYIDTIASDTQEQFCARTNKNKELTCIRPIYDSNNQPSAYVVVQTSLKSLHTDLNIYFIRIFSLLFGIGILIVAYVFWFYDKSIMKPIDILVRLTKEVGVAKPEGERLRDKVQVTSGDEMEYLFRAMCEAQDSIIRSDNASKSKTAFLSKLSHEIRTPLNSVIGFSKLAMNDKKTITKEELLDYMQKIQISGNYLLELVSDVLDISRIEEGRMTVQNEACRLEDIIEEVVDSFQGQVKGKNQEFVVDKDYGDILLYMDDFHTIQILNNLISNACKYTDEGGVVGFEIHAKQMGEKKVQVTYIVQDTGIGMSEEFQKKIFEPFTQDKRGMKLKNQLRGSGLGMSICKNLVDLLGGTITLESEEGEGSCFTVTINYELIGRAHETETMTEDDYSVLRGKKILVVDDLEMNRIVVEKMLASYGFEFVDAEDGKQAIELYAASEPGEYFAIFMDVQMPEMNGLEATRFIRGMKAPYNEVPILGMTADAFSDDVKRTKECGMNYHVTKPVQVHKVLTILMELVGQKSENETNT